ncbi:MAG: Sec-independent protein translocase protein TatB [Syntrophorhabdus sp.]
MFGIGLPELILILIVALLVVGPKKLPELARSVGKALHDVKSMTDDVKESFTGDFSLESNSDDGEQKDTPQSGNEPKTHKKDEEAESHTGHHSPEEIKSDPYGNLRG